mmetsp:Transcript_795/g.1203  ORF Transcript_795/g.1203 Transcript_795/m.1203 type:complete len:869 (-) Transcript_795:244-2850(-)
MDSVEIWLEKLVTEIDRAVKSGIDHLPDFERYVLELIDQLFSPRLVLRSVVVISILQVLLVSYTSLSQVWAKMIMNLTEVGRKERDLLMGMTTARSYDQWKRMAGKLDTLRGNDVWRKQDHSLLYDDNILTRRIKFTREMLRRGDVFDLMFRLRGGLARDQFGMQHEGLFSRALGGTKLIVERYLETMAEGLNFICDSPIADEEIPTDAKLAFFNETRHAYGRTALLLSGGAFLGFYHMGVVKALWLEGLLPRVISGASAGSIITGIIGTHTDDELRKFFNLDEDNRERKDVELPDGVRTDFFRYSEELKSELARKLNYFVPQGLRWLTLPVFSSVFDRKLLNLDTEHLKRCLIADVGLHTFQEAFDKTGRIINITVAPNNNYDPPRLLNYLTAPHVCVWSAAAASCALPGIFDSVSLIVKEPNGQFRPETEWTRQALVDNEDIKAANLASYSDGSVENDLPMQQLSELFNVNHFIVSQVNPHSAILSSMAGGLAATVWSNPLYNMVVGYLRFLTAQCRDWLKNVINLFVFRSRAPVWSNRRGFVQTLTQDYEGRDVDVTINPWSQHISAFTALRSAIHNPTLEEYRDVLNAAQAATWPAIPRIRAHCLVEMTLDHCVQRLRKRLSDESHAVHVAALANHIQQRQSAAGGTAAGGGMRGKDRTPSFYTSKSIVNLSGLSVADPAPINVWQHGNGSSEQLVAAGGSRRGSRSQMRNSSSAAFGGSGSSFGSADALLINADGNLSNSASAIDYLTLTVDGNDIPLAGDNNSSSNSSSLPSTAATVFGTVEDVAAQARSYDSLTATAAAAAVSGGGDGSGMMRPRRLSGAQALANSSSGSLMEENMIHKSTNMASFYYKKSESSEQLKDMA